jgi:hypothetical protein
MVNSRIIGVALGNIMPTIITDHMMVVSRNNPATGSIAMSGMSSMPDVARLRPSK